MQTNEYLTNDEYERFVELQSKFINCIEQCGVEIFEMQYKRPPVGEFCSDYELYDGDRYMVHFETHQCGESDRDTVYVPIMYMHDEGYREYYGKHLESVKRAKEEAKELEKQRKEYVRVIDIEERDRAEYERLKIKYSKEELA